MRWRSYWLRHEGDSLPYNTLGVLPSAKEILIIIFESSSNIDNWSGFRSGSQVLSCFRN